jgi:hypothetical protein
MAEVFDCETQAPYRAQSSWPLSEDVRRRLERHRGKPAALRS